MMKESRRFFVIPVILMGSLCIVLPTSSFGQSAKKQGVTASSPTGSSEVGAARNAGFIVKKIDKDAVLITDGFPYRKDMEYGGGHVINIKEISERAVFAADKDSVVHMRFVPTMLSGPVSGLPTFSGKGIMFVPMCTADSKSSQKLQTNTGQPGMNIEYLADTVGQTWIFNEPGMSFTVKNTLFTSNTKGASIKFTQEGVLLKGFTINWKN